MMKSTQSKGGFMKHNFSIMLSIVAGLAIANMAFAAQRVVLCEEAYSEG